jgi:hypothetical protein
MRWSREGRRRPQYRYENADSYSEQLTRAHIIKWL